MLKTKKSKKPMIPTEQEFKSYRPKRADFKWNTDAEGLVYLTVPKFKGNFGKSFCKMVKKENHFRASMDKLGSIVWKNCDGEKTVADILGILEKEFPDEDNINQRLYLFLQQMNHLSYIYL